MDVLAIDIVVEQKISNMFSETRKKN